MDFDGPPEVSMGDGKNGVAVRGDVLWQQKEGGEEAAAAEAARATVQLPNVQAPMDLPQVDTCVWRDCSRCCTIFVRLLSISERELLQWYDTYDA